jgi:hypothetical protein
MRPTGVEDQDAFTPDLAKALQEKFESQGWI